MKQNDNSAGVKGFSVNAVNLCATIQLIKLIDHSIFIWGTVARENHNYPAQLTFATDQHLCFQCNNETLIRKEKRHSEDPCHWIQNFTCCIPSSVFSVDKVTLSLFSSYGEDGCQIVLLNYGRSCITGSELGLYTQLADELLICGTNDHIILRRASRNMVFRNRIANARALLCGTYPNSKAALLARIVVQIIRGFYHKRPLWLMNDRIDQAGDNGEAFFRWVAANRAGEVTPVFVIHKKAEDALRLQQYGRVVHYGTWKHKLFYLACEIVFSSAGETTFLLPLSNRYTVFFRDIVSQKKLVYLQHGVTKSDLSHWLGIREKNFFGFITSAMKERDYILSRYGYTEDVLWLTGMARFDIMAEALDRVPVPKQITIMPTWRKYLMGNLNNKDGSRAVVDGFEESIYVKAFRALTNDVRLKAVAREYGYTISFRPHPNMVAHIEKFHFSDDIIIDTRPVAEVFANTALLINDYSSGSMDYSYLYRPVVFYQFDREQFFSGAHTFTEENIDYEEDAFGELVFDHEQLIDLIIEYIKSGCSIKKKYKDRINKFFQYHDFNNCQRIYEKAKIALSMNNGTTII